MAHATVRVHPAAEAEGDDTDDGALQRAWQTRRRLHAARATLIGVLCLVALFCVQFLAQGSPPVPVWAFSVTLAAFMGMVVVAYRDLCSFKTWRRVASVVAAMLPANALLFVRNAEAAGDLIVPDVAVRSIGAMVVLHWLAVHWIVFPWLAFCHLGAVGVAAVWTGTLLSAATQGSVVTILMVGASMAVLAYQSDRLVVEQAARDRERQRAQAAEQRAEAEQLRREFAEVQAELAASVARQQAEIDAMAAAAEAKAAELHRAKMARAFLSHEVRNQLFPHSVMLEDLKEELPARADDGAGRRPGASALSDRDRGRHPDERPQPGEVGERRHSGPSPALGRLRICLQRPHLFLRAFGQRGQRTGCWAAGCGARTLGLFGHVRFVVVRSCADLAHTPWPAR